MLTRTDQVFIGGGRFMKANLQKSRQAKILS